MKTSRQNSAKKILEKGQKAAAIAALVSFLLAVIKALVGFLSGSIALISDALHSGADLVVMLASWFGLKIAQRKPDEKFPYGYYKAESLATLFISIFIIYSSFELMKHGYERLFVLSKINIPLVALSTATISVAASFFVSRYLSSVGKKINSQLLITNARERMTDVISSLVVFIAILMTYYKVPYVEGFIAIVISVLILKVGLSSAKDSVFALMDVSPSRKKEEAIRKIIKNTEGVDELGELKLRKAGPFVFGEADVKVKKFANVSRAHEIADQIERKIKEKFKEVNAFTIHIEPYESQKHRVAIPIKKPKGLNSEVVEHFGRADYFLFVDINKKKINRFYSKPNPNKTRTVRAGLSTVHFLVKEKVDVLITKEMGEISFHSARDNLIDIYKTEGKTAKRVIENFLKNKLVKLTKHTRKKD
ncbi:MAG: hypothetical protein B6U68_02630 [Candidatus Aenigmarchaeota archaeon ex4484_14]|nr:MAG: hypothetical protein B6U68_02630 [Candidatus Aenigmarchaeota archaeon ex4484_14]